MSAAPITQAQHCLNEALRLVDHGYALAPVTLTRLPNGKKHAQFHVRWRHEESWSRDPEQIKSWWVDHPDTSFAMGGAANGIEGPDLDVGEHKDGVLWWSAQGLPLAELVQRTPSGGIHLIWRARPGDIGLPQSVDGLKGVDTRNRAGLFYASGSYIVGESGHYSIDGELPQLSELAFTPPEVLALFAGMEKTQRPADGRIVEHDLEWQQAQVKKALEAVRSFDRDADAGYRSKIQHLGLFYGRIIEQGITDAETAERQWRKAHCAVWGAEVWPENVKDFRDALRDGPALERWRTPETAAAEETPDAFELEILREIRNQDVREVARQRRAVRDREPLRVLDFDAFLDAPPPNYLVPGMLYRDGIAVVFGAPGAAKSFLVLDIALSLAAGTPWRGSSLGTGVVHYVMAEGQSTNTLRAQAWMHHHGVGRDAVGSRFKAIPSAVMLTDAGVVDYLARVQQDQPDLIVLDTKNLMFVGKESQGDDYGAMLRVLHRLREAAGGAAVVLIDHSGLGDDTRTRGSNAQKGGVETEIKVSNLHGVRRAEVTRDKSGDEGASWLYRLEQVPEVERPAGVTAPAVCIPLDPSEVSSALPFSGLEDWNDSDQLDLPPDVATYDGRGRAAIRALARFMRHSASAGVGFTQAGARKAVQDRIRDEKGKPIWSNDTIDRAWGALVDLSRLELAEGGKKTARSLWVTHVDDSEWPN